MTTAQTDHKLNTIHKEYTVTKRIGFACKFMEATPKGMASVQGLNTGTTTVAWLNRQTRAVAEQKLYDLSIANIEAVRRLVDLVGDQTPALRMMRVGSDILPVYTEASWRYFYQDAAFRQELESRFAAIGEIARAKDVRLSFHPGQFCCIVSDKNDVVERSIDELEYHADMARWMGYGNSKLDFKINVHLSGKLGVDGFNQAWTKMSTELRNCLTIENDEYQAGVNDILKLKDKVGIVLDIHHHLIHSCEYIQSTDDRIKQIIESWNGVRPVIHYSQSKDEYISNLDHLPDIQLLVENFKKSKLRAHSDFYNHKPTNDWAKAHWEWADVMAESKAKNLASFKLYQEWQECI